MAEFMAPVLDSVDALLSWFSSALKQTTESYCDLETADSKTTLVCRDGSLCSVLRLEGVTALVGTPEFERLYTGFASSVESAMSHIGTTIQVFFNYDKDGIQDRIEEILSGARRSCNKMQLELDDLFEERITHLSRYCANESLFMVLWSRPGNLTKDQLKNASKDKLQFVRENKLPSMKDAQMLNAAIPDLRDTHDSLVRSVVNDLNQLDLRTELLDAHEAIYQMRMTVDPDFTDTNWRPYLPGDTIPVRAMEENEQDISNLLWPSLARQILPRDAENLDLKVAQVGDRIYAPLFIELFPKQLKSFINLFSRTLPLEIPWRISFLMDSDGITSIRFKATLAAILSFTSTQNRLLANANSLLNSINVNTDDPVVKLRVALATWAPVGEDRLLRTRISQLAKAVQGWGSCEVTELSGDPFGGTVSSMLGVTTNSTAIPSVAPLSDVSYMLPITRPASPWKNGALLFRSPDGKPWPFQPGSSQQTTWIDILYARPGSGKSVLSNAINLALCLAPGIQRLPRIAIIDIGPSSSGLISLLKEALPADQHHLVAYHRMRMTPDYSINPFDTQLGCRFPTPQERSFLVNFITLLATPTGQDAPYDGVAEMAGMVVDELYKDLSDKGTPHTYTPGLEFKVDELLEEIGFVQDSHTTWWEVTDALFLAGYVHEASLAQRYAMPLVADAASMCRSPSVEDLYGKITVSTGESLINAFSRLISSAVREYPTLSRITSFDLGDARVVSLDLDEVAKSGGESADRQTAVMYMLARYVLARHYYLTEENVSDMPHEYHNHHKNRIAEIREDQKRIVFDEFHRTSSAKAVRDQVIVDMREGRKWNVQVALISQSIEDYDSIMVEFATSIFIMDAGPQQAVQKTSKVFGLSETGQFALETRVHGPRAGGATFLAQFATKTGINTQLLTLTLGPIELWAFSTTAEDAYIRNKLYEKIGPIAARRLLATLFPSGTVTKFIEKRLEAYQDEEGLIKEEDKRSVIDQLLGEILDAYSKNPDIRQLPT